MTIIDSGPYRYHHLVYNAPINEKTKKIRELFKVDEESGYPEHYKWRSMARLGSKYNPEDPYLKFDPYKKEEYYSTKVVTVALTGFTTLLLHMFFSYNARRPIWSKSYSWLASWAALGYACHWYQEASLTKQAIKNAITMDYAKKHSERFGEIKRYKIRECLYHFHPCR